MNNDIKQLAAAVEMLCTGWTERVEYTVSVQVEKNGLHYTCDEQRVKRMRQAALLVQLQQAGTQLASKTQSGTGSTNKPGSRPPGNSAYSHLIEAIADRARMVHAEMYQLHTGRPPQWDMRKSPVIILRSVLEMALVMEHESPRAVREARQQMQRLVKRARELLGYERPQVLLESTVCGDCGGALIVASDASTDVRCIGTPSKGSCGTVYRRDQWLSLL